MKKNDLRVLRNSAAIKKAFLHLLQEKPYDDISVIDITNRADMARGTFYRHYESKQACLEEMFCDAFADCIDYSSVPALRELRDKNEPAPLGNPVVETLYIEEVKKCRTHRPIFQAAFSHLDYHNLTMLAMPIYEESYFKIHKELHLITADPDVCRMFSQAWAASLLSTLHVITNLPEVDHLPVEKLIYYNRLWYYDVAMNGGFPNKDTGKLLEENLKEIL